MPCAIKEGDVINSKKKLKMLSVMLLVMFICNFNYIIKDKAPLFFNVTPSMPIGVYMMIPGNQYKKGDLVVYTPTDESLDYFRKYDYDRPDTDFLKEIGAMPGESYSVDADNGNFWAADKYIGIAKRQDSFGNCLPDHSGTYTVPSGEFLPVTYYSGSFDGRYTGTVSFSRIKNKVIPIIIFND